jgi:hypothetical protein
LNDYEHTDYNERLLLIGSIKARFANLSPANKPLSLSAKIILLDYLGVTKMLEDKGFTQKQQAALWGSLLDRSPENTKKTLSKVGGRIGKSTSVKNETSLRSVKDVADKLNFEELNMHIDRDLNILNQSKQKKG